MLRDGRALNLAPKPWAVLCYLAQRPGELVSKDALLDAVWGHRFVSDSVLKVTVNALRQALGEDARQATWLQTVPRRGYRFCIDGEPGAPAAPPPPDTRAAAAPPPMAPVLGNLPVSVGPLLGRAQAIDELLVVLASQRLITMVGPGGVGKTRLALAALHGRAAPDGTWLIHLEDLQHAAALSLAVARTIGLGDNAGRSPETLACAMAPLDLVLLLDNAEHLVEALAPQIALWLRQAPRLQLLITSQRPLQLPQEHLYHVAPLALPDAQADAPSLGENPAIALMVQLVQRQRPGWQPAAADLRDLAATAHALDGLPLALELAAARVLLLGAAGVRQRLGARLDMLTTGRSHGPQRQRTLRASLEWSVALLPPLAARALERLSVFVGGFSAEAAQAVLARALPDADEWTILDALQLLQEMALIGCPAVAAPAAAPMAEVPRMRLLDSVRLLGLERLAAANDLHHAHADHRAWALALFLDAEHAYLEMGVERWLTPLEGETDNLMAAVERGLAQLQTPNPALLPDAQRTLTEDLASLLAAATNFCLRTGLGQQLGAWRERLQAQITASGCALAPVLRARWYLGGAMLGGQGLVPVRDALALGERAVADLPAGPRLQLALYVSGLFQLRLGQREALEQTLQRMAAPTQADSRVYVRRLRPMLQASIDQRDANLAPYLAFWSDALHESRALGDRFESWRAAWGVGQALFLQGQQDAAIATMDEAIDDIRNANRLRTQAGFASQAVLVRLARDASTTTLQRLHEVLPLLRAQGMLFSALGDALAWVALHHGRLVQAQRIQAWADLRTQAEKSVRNPLAQLLRERFTQQVGTIPSAIAPAHDEDEALRLALESAPTTQHPATPASNSIHPVLLRNL